MVSLQACAGCMSQVIMRSETVALCIAPKEDAYCVHSGTAASLFLARVWLLECDITIQSLYE